MGKIIGIVFIGIIAIIIIFIIITQGPRLLFTGFDNEIDTTTDGTFESDIAGKGSLDEQALLKFGLRTNTLQNSIPLDAILNGGPERWYSCNKCSCF